MWGVGCEDLTYLHGVPKGDNCRHNGALAVFKEIMAWKHFPRIVKRHQNSDLKSTTNFKQDK